MAGRLIVGAALIVAAPRMLFSQAFAWFGIALVVSSTVLLCLPWTWHRAFGERVLPGFVRFLGIVGPICLFLGAMLIAAVVAGNA
jgi:hypothetical protein